MLCACASSKTMGSMSQIIPRRRYYAQLDQRHSTATSQPCTTRLGDYPRKLNHCNPERKATQSLPQPNRVARNDGRAVASPSCDCEASGYPTVDLQHPRVAPPAPLIVMTPICGAPDENPVIRCEEGAFRHRLRKPFCDFDSCDALPVAKICCRIRINKN